MYYHIINREEYKGKIVLNHCDYVIRYYTKKQIRNLYPNKNYKVVGEIGNTSGSKINSAYTTEDKVTDVFCKGSYNRILDQSVGFAEIEDNIYLAIVKNVFIIRFLILMIMLIILVAVIYYIQ